MEKTLISVIVPAYNIAPYLPRCLDSIRAQTYQNLEIILVDDGSVDETGAIIDRYAAKDSRIVPIHKCNGGVSSARRTGLDRASGAWIGFIDGDDCIDPEMYTRLMENAMQNSADISHCGYKMIYPDGHTDYYYNTGRIVQQDRLQGCIDLLKGDFVEPGLWNKLFRRELFDGLAEWMDDSIRINEDLLMNFYLFGQAKRAVYEDFCPYHYILRKGSATSSKVQRYKLLDPLKVIRRLKKATAGQPTLVPIVYERYIRVLIGLATQQDWPEDAAEAKKTLRRELRSGALLRDCPSAKLKLMAVGMAYMQPVYRTVRKVYNRVTGIDKKYDI